MIKRECGSYTDPKTGLKIILVKTDNKVKGLVKISQGAK